MIQSILLFLSYIFLSSSPSPKEQVSLVKGDSLGIRIVDYDELKPMLTADNDTTYVFNFWATWCAPCVKEIPYFIQLDSMYENSPFKLVLVSLDFKKDYLKRLKPFVQEKELGEYVLILEDNRSNYWIEDIHKNWGGSIPATLVFNGQKRAFYERTFHDVNELSDIVKPFLKP